MTFVTFNVDFSQEVNYEWKQRQPTGLHQYFTPTTKKAQTVTFMGMQLSHPIWNLAGKKKNSKIQQTYEDKDSDRTLGNIQ